MGWLSNRSKVKPLANDPGWPMARGGQGGTATTPPTPGETLYEAVVRQAAELGVTPKERFAQLGTTEQALKGLSIGAGNGGNGGAGTGGGGGGSSFSAGDVS